MSPETAALEEDDTASPAALAVLEGQALWSRPEGTQRRSCAACHGDPTRSMQGVAARYPAIDNATGQPVDLSGRINLCRETHQSATALPVESPEMLALTALIARQSRGQPVAAPNPAMTPLVETGRALYWQRQGQLNLACGHCHTLNWGRRLGGALIPQAHPTGYPIYRLEWQSMGSLQRRIRNCLAGIRAEPYAYGAPEMLALEAYLHARAAGMIMDAPGVRP